jgi:hypothetical protein
VLTAKKRNVYLILQQLGHLWFLVLLFPDSEKKLHFNLSLAKASTEYKLSV